MEIIEYIAIGIDLAFFIIIAIHIRKMNHHIQKMEEHMEHMK
jgi:hypothetical protein